MLWLSVLQLCNYFKLVLIILKTTISHNISSHRDTKAAIYRYIQIVHRCTSNVCYEVIAHNILMAEIFTIKLTDWINLNIQTVLDKIFAKSKSMLPCQNFCTIQNVCMDACTYINVLYERMYVCM